VVEVWDINLYSLGAFRALWSQWRAVAGLGGLIWLGLDYGAVMAVLNGRPRKERAAHPTMDVLADLREMESEALALRNERRK